MPDRGRLVLTTRRVLGGAVLVALLAQVLRNRGVIPLRLDPQDTLCDVLFGLAALACWRRGRSRGPGVGPDRAAWRLLGLALASYLTGDVLAWWLQPPPGGGPSVADAFWLGFYALTYAAIVTLHRARFRRLSRTAWLDGAIGGVGAAALVAAFAFEPLLTRSPGRPLVVATGLAYPVADVLLAFLLVVAGTGARRADRAWWLLALSLGCYCVGDLFALLSPAAGHGPGVTYVWQLAWAVGVAVIALAALVRPTPTRQRPAIAYQYTTPVLFTATSIALLIVGQRVPLPPVALALTVLALALSTTKLALTVRDSLALTRSQGEARTDELTGLPNRRHIAELTAAALSRAGREPVSLIVLDLDRFKDINDSLGEDAGDLLLLQVSRRLQRCVGLTGTFARQGGDEFAVLLPDYDVAEAAQVAAQLRAALERPFELSGLPVSVQASMGVASAPAHGQSAEQLLSRADIAMYQAKRSSTGVATYRVEQGNPSRERLQLLGELRQALASDAFMLHYQPQIDLATGQLCGVEALVRWHHATRGVLLPADFLRLVAETGQMTELTRVALRRARADWAWLQALGPIPRMSVNVTAADLAHEAFPSAVEALLGITGFAAGRLVLEVTEDDVLRDRAHGHAVLQHLRDLGCLVAIDDYGTGQASLSYLRDLPLDEIKLDQSFVRGAATDTHNAAIVRSTIELAHTLGLPIVAEGIEDHDTQDWLRTLGCDIGQGYHIARPMPADQLTRWLGRRLVA